MRIRAHKALPKLERKTKSAQASGLTSGEMFSFTKHKAEASTELGKMRRFL